MALRAARISSSLTRGRMGGAERAQSPGSRLRLSAASSSGSPPAVRRPNRRRSAAPAAGRRPRCPVWPALAARRHASPRRDSATHPEQPAGPPDRRVRPRRRPVPHELPDAALAATGRIAWWRLRRGLRSAPAAGRSPAFPCPDHRPDRRSTAASLRWGPRRQAGLRGAAAPQDRGQTCGADDPFRGKSFVCFCENCMRYLLACYRPDGRGLNGCFRGRRPLVNPASRPQRRFSAP